MPKEFDEFADEHPEKQCLDGKYVRLVIPVLGGHITEEDQSEISNNGWGWERRQMHGVGAPWLSAATQTPLVSLSFLDEMMRSLSSCLSPIQESPPMSLKGHGLITAFFLFLAFTCDREI